MVTGMGSGGPYIFPGWISTTDTLLLLRDLGVDPTSERAQRAIGLVCDNSTWGPEFDEAPFFEGEVEPCINVVSISVTDLNIAREFYSNVLGLGIPAFDLPEMGWIEFKSGAPYGNIAVTTAEAGWQPSTGTTLVFNTDDCHKTCAELGARGVSCDNPVVVPGYVTYCNSMIRLVTGCKCAVNCQRPNGNEFGV